MLLSYLKWINLNVLKADKYSFEKGCVIILVGEFAFRSRNRKTQEVDAGVAVGWLGNG